MSCFMIQVVLLSCLTRAHANISRRRCGVLYLSVSVACAYLGLPMTICIYRPCALCAFYVLVLRCEASEDEWAKRKSPFSTTRLSSAQRTPANIHINFIWLETGIIWLHFCCWQCGSVFIQIFVVGSERRICNVTERIIAVQSQFKVIQGRWFCYQSKARMWLPVSDQ